MSTEASLLEVHARLLPAEAPAGSHPEGAWHPGDLGWLVVQATVQGDGRLVWPSRSELHEAVSPSLAVTGDGVEAPVMAGASGLPEGLGATTARRWPVQVVLAPGEHEVEGGTLELVSEAGEPLDRAGIPPVRLTVVSVLEDELVARLQAAEPEATAAQAAEAMAPLRGPWALEGPWPVLPVAGTLLLIAALIGAAAWLGRGRTGGWRPERPPEPPEVVARRRLAALAEARLLDTGRHLAHHVELADILRTYLGARYGVDVRERTTDEVRTLLAGTLADRPGVDRARASVVAVLEACDLVKFAREVPDVGAARVLIEDVRALVDETTRAATVAAAAETEAPPEPDELRGAA